MLSMPIQDRPTHSLPGLPAEAFVPILARDKTPQRTVIMTREVGFCFGVKRAIHLTRQALSARDNVFIQGALIHNKHVTDGLAAEGLRNVEDFTREKTGTMVIRAHGLPKAKIQEVRAQSLENVNATYP